MADEMDVTTIYVRGMNKESADDEDIWDDSALTSAYDNALKVADIQVAKRIAMATNSKKTDSGNISGRGKSSIKKAAKVLPNTKTPIVWKEGMPCRAVYEEDGLEYEAFILSIIDDRCIVRFLGYNNDEEVELSALQRSQGDAARSRQITDAARETRERGADDGFESQPGSESVDQHSDESSMPESTAHIGIGLPTNKKKKSNKKKTNQNPTFGDLPTLTMPSMDMFKNMGTGEMPLPPPPPMMVSGRSDADEQAISNMLLSWYMTGYYTGLYQGMKRQKPSRKYR